MKETSEDDDDDLPFVSILIVMEVENEAKLLTQTTFCISRFNPYCYGSRK